MTNMKSYVGFPDQLKAMADATWTHRRLLIIRKYLGEKRITGDMMLLDKQGFDAAIDKLVQEDEDRAAAEHARRVFVDEQMAEPPKKRKVKKNA